jgi:XTP/dITP diphosphohydrolase
MHALLELHKAALASSIKSPGALLNRGVRKLVVGSSNPGKLREIAAILTSQGIEAVAQAAFTTLEAAEPHGTFIENALAKARHASRVARLPALADDSGICVAALNGAPGVYSARYAGEPRCDERNRFKLLQDMAEFSERSAHYYCVLVLLRHADDPQPLLAEGVWRGEIGRELRGTGGFGYDPLFWLPDLACSAAELDPAHKNRISHRGLALAALCRRLREETFPAGTIDA